VSEWRKLQVTPHVGTSFAWNHRNALFLQETPYFAVKITKNTKHVINSLDGQLVGRLPIGPAWHFSPVVNRTDQFVPVLAYAANV
jgi:hypothetical protein